MLTPREKSPLPETRVGGTGDAASRSEPNTLPTELFRPAFYLLTVVCWSMIIMIMMKIMMMMMMIMTTTIMIIIMMMNIIALKCAIRDFLQSPHCATNCLQHLRPSGQGAIVCKSSTTHRAFITWNMPRDTKGQLSH